MTGSDYQTFLVCGGKFVDECGGPNGTADADGCVWEPLLFYGGIESYNANHAQLEANMVGRAVCVTCICQCRRIGADHAGALRIRHSRRC